MSRESWVHAAVDIRVIIGANKDLKTSCSINAKGGNLNTSMDVAQGKTEAARIIKFTKDTKPSLNNRDLVVADRSVTMVDNTRIRESHFVSKQAIYLNYKFQRIFLRVAKNCFACDS